ncbi:MAG: hypothetical protein P8008_06590, partial [Gammaproteobacteria bacterium]
RRLRRGFRPRSRQVGELLGLRSRLGYRLWRFPSFESFPRLWPCAHFEGDLQGIRGRGSRFGQAEGTEQEPAVQEQGERQERGVGPAILNGESSHVSMMAKPPVRVVKSV